MANKMGSGRNGVTSCGGQGLFCLDSLHLLISVEIPVYYCGVSGFADM